LDNGFILGGGIDSAVNITYPNGVTSSSNYFRMFLIKRNENGDVIWSKKYALNDFNGAADIVENDGDGFYIAAYAHQSGSVSTDGLLMRLDEDGNTLWTKSFGGSFSEGVSDLEKTADGNLIICGTSESFSNNQNIYVIKMDTAGNLIWSKTYGSTGFDYGKSILEAPDGGFFVYGNAGTGNPSYLTLLKIDADGNIQWSNTYKNSLFDSPEKLQYDNSGNLIAIAGHLTSSHDGLFLLIDTGGNPIRNKTFGKQSSGSNDFITSVLPIESGYLLGSPLLHTTGVVLNCNDVIVNSCRRITIGFTSNKNISTIINSYSIWLVILVRRVIVRSRPNEVPASAVRLGNNIILLKAAAIRFPCYIHISRTANGHVQNFIGAI
jgi:hypothetical protein